MDLAFIAAVGLVGGFCAGWIGLGGGIIIAPLLLYVPPIVGLSPFDMKEAARLTVLQSLFGTATAGAVYFHAGQMHRRLVLWMGTIIALAAFAGAVVSELHVVSNHVLLAVFAGMAILAAALMLRRPAAEAEAPDPINVAVPVQRGRAAAIALAVGFLGGMVGQSGAFLTIPLLIHALRLPVRLAIGSALGITFCAALAASAGKLAGGAAIDWAFVAALVAGSLIGGQLGAALGRRTSTGALRYVLAAFIAASAVRALLQVVAL